MHLPCNAGDPGSIPELGRSPGEGIGYPVQDSSASLVAQLAKYLPAMWDPLGKGKATHSVFWPGEFHGLYSPWGLKELDMTERLSLPNWEGSCLLHVGVAVMTRLRAGGSDPKIAHSHGDKWY